MGYPQDTFMIHFHNWELGHNKQGQQIRTCKKCKKTQIKIYTDWYKDFYEWKTIKDEKTNKK